MPTLSRWFLKAGLIYFATSFVLLLGIHLQALSPAPAFLPVFYHLLFVGWITQIIMGVSHWMFPRHTREKPRGNEAPGWAAFTGINLGLLLRCLGEPMQWLHPHPRWAALLALSAGLQALGGALYVVHIWPRVKGKENVS